MYKVLEILLGEAGYTVEQTTVNGASFVSYTSPTGAKGDAPFDENFTLDQTRALAFQITSAP
jgi:hypothetical protein